MSIRAIVIVVGLVVAQLLLAVLLLGVFHSPTLHKLPVAVAGQGPLAGGLVTQHNTTPQRDGRAGGRRVAAGRPAGTLIPRADVRVACAPGGKVGTVIVASAASRVVGGVLPQIF